jgi:O-antigen/teichoic acid export membrane protein
VVPAPVLHLLFGQSYNHAESMIRILALGNLVLILGGNPINLLTLTGRHRAALPVNVLSTLIIAVGGPLATMRYGAAGLAWMSTCAIAVQHSLLWSLARWKLGIWTHVGWPSLSFGGEPKAPDNTTTTEYVSPSTNRLDWNRQNACLDREVAVSLSTELEK